MSTEKSHLKGTAFKIVSDDEGLLSVSDFMHDLSYIAPFFSHSKCGDR